MKREGVAYALRSMWQDMTSMALNFWESFLFPVTCVIGAVLVALALIKIASLWPLASVSIVVMVILAIWFRFHYMDYVWKTSELRAACFLPEEEEDDEHAQIE